MELKRIKKIICLLIFACLLAGCAAQQNVIPVGMGQVSSINFLENVKPGARVTKGDELGYSVTPMYIAGRNMAGFNNSASMPHIIKL